MILDLTILVFSTEDYHIGVKYYFEQNYKQFLTTTLKVAGYS